VRDGAVSGVVAIQPEGELAMDRASAWDVDASIVRWVHELSNIIGERNDRDSLRYKHLGFARDLILRELSEAGASARVCPYRVGELSFDNIELELPGSRRDAPAIVVGAHYDTARTAPGANDNGSAVACLLALARLLQGERLGCPVRLVAFTNEEPPHTRAPTMGSLVYASRLAYRGVELRGMLSLETLSIPRTLSFVPVPLFVAGNLHSRRLAKSFRGWLGPIERCRTLALAAPGFLPGIRSSDHWSFWQHGWPAVMLTAGGPLTYPHYHGTSDRMENMRLDHLGAVARACAKAIATWSSQSDPA